MPTDPLLDLLEQVRQGTLNIAAARGQLADSAAASLHYATVDLDRQRRCGYPEVIFCQGKTSDWVAGVVQKLVEAQQDALATLVSDDQALALARLFPQAQQDRVARTFWLPVQTPQLSGKVVILTAGTSDLPVAREALVTANALGAQTHLVADVGVAGIHRLLKHRDTFQDADAIVVCAGMDGALPSVVGGLVDRPVIAVPTSIGYGAALGGIAPLLTMLNSCSANVVVVNIDSGFKAGYVAAMMSRKRSR